MEDQNYKNKLISIYAIRQKFVEEQAPTIESNMKFQKHGASSLWYDNSFFGLYYYFIADNIVKAKQSYYKCGRLTEFLIKNYDSPILD